MPKRKRPRTTSKKCRKNNLTGKYRGQVIGHDVDMLCNTIYSVGYLDGDEEGLSLLLSLGKSINRSYFNYQYDHYTVNKIDFSYIF